MPRVPDRLTRVGQVAPGENFKHEVELFAAPGDWLKPWMTDTPSAVMAKARPGRATINDGRVVGRLIIEEAKYEKFAAKGRVALQAGGSQAIVNPQDLVITTASPRCRRCSSRPGALEIDGSTIRARRCASPRSAASAQLDGSGDLAAKSGEFDARMARAARAGKDPARRQSEGDRADALPRRAGSRGDADHARQRHRRAAGTARFTLNGSGRSWTDMAGRCAAAPRVDAKQPVLVENFSAPHRAARRAVTLQSVDWPGHQVSGRREFRTRRTRTGRSARSGRGLPRAAATADGADADRVQRRRARRRQRNQLTHSRCAPVELDLTMNGRYVWRVPKPVDLHFNVTHSRNGRAAWQADRRRRCAGSSSPKGDITGTPTRSSSTSPARCARKPRRARARVRRHDGGTRHSSPRRTSPRPPPSFTVSELKLLGGACRRARLAVQRRGPARRRNRPGPRDDRRRGLEAEDIGDAAAQRRSRAAKRAGEWTIDIPFPPAQRGRRRSR